MGDASADLPASSQLSDEAFAEACFRHLIGRDGDSVGRARVVARLRAGASRREVIAELVAGEEFLARAEREIGAPVADAWPAGHFHSPRPDLELVANAYAKVVRADRDTVPGIDMRPAVQRAWLDRFAALQAEVPFKEEPGGPCRYHAHNPMFPGGDALVLWSLMRCLRPRRVVEVGSGFSSAVMLDTNELHLGHSVSFTFVEPYPDRLRSLLRGDDAARCQILEAPVQDVPLATFEELEANDILFVDSSHVSKFGSDVNYLLFEVLPRLRRGVVVHFHDVFWPFDYTKEWLMAGRGWNEAYALRAFLIENRAFSVLLFVDWLRRFERPHIARTVPLLADHAGGSVWIVRE